MDRIKAVEELGKLLPQLEANLLAADLCAVHEAHKALKEPSEASEMIVENHTRYLTNIMNDYTFYQQNPTNKEVLGAAVKVMQDVRF